MEFVGFVASCEETLTAPLPQMQLPEVPASSRFIVFLHESSLPKKIRGWSSYRQMSWTGHLTPTINQGTIQNCISIAHKSPCLNSSR